MNEDLTYTVCIPEDKSGMRLDKLLTEACTDFSRSRIKSLILGGHVFIDQNVEISPSAKVQGGVKCEILIPPLVEALPKPQKIHLEIMFEDFVKILSVLSTSHSTKQT